MKLNQILEILIKEVLPIFGSVDNRNAIEQAIEIINELIYKPCSDPPIGERYYMEENGERRYRYLIINSEVYGWIIGFYDSENGIWYDAKTGYPFNYQMIDSDKWIALPVDEET